jgi:hypothetical protein
MVVWLGQAAKRSVVERSKEARPNLFIKCIASPFKVSDFPNGRAPHSRLAIEPEKKELAAI